MKKIYYLLSFILTLNVNLFGQTIGSNLVKNGGFEIKRDPDFCPNWSTASMNPFPAADWSAILSSDYYHTCATEARVNPNLNGQTERTNGKAYSGFVAFLKGHLEYTEYLYQTLNAPLKKGVKYQIEFWVSLKDNNGYAVKTLGMYLTDNLSDFTNKSYLEIHRLPDQINNTKILYENKNGWTKISGIFTPTIDGIQHIIVGNFDEQISNTSPNAVQLYTGTSSEDFIAYYYIDDLSILEDCSSYQEDISITNTVVSNQVFQASNSITASSGIGKDLTVTYQAGTSIKLTPGFSVFPGASGRFNAIIAVCSTSRPQVVTNTIIDNKDEASSKDIVSTKVSKLQVHPNPTDGKLNVTYSFPDQETNCEIRIVDIWGRTIYLKSFEYINNTDIEIDLSSVLNGMYYVIVKDTVSNKVTIKKVVVNK